MNNTADDPNWPNASMPGVPLNPEKNGWHWLGGSPRRWAGDGIDLWVAEPFEHDPAEVALLKYGGPCFSLTDLRNERERCALVCEDRSKSWLPTIVYFRGAHVEARACTTAIRALGDKT